MQTSIVIYEDNNDFREALVQLINTSENYTCLEAFYDCTNVIEDIQTLQPQVILMDIEMPERNGIEAMQLIRNVNKEVKIIMLTVFDDNKNVLSAIGAGASGYLLKKNSFEKLFDAIDEVMHGGAPMSANVARLVLDFVASNTSFTDEEFNLTSREKEILTQLVKGFSYKMIGASLDISFQTVKTHIRNIYEKLHVHNQSEAVAKALKNHIIK
jgi:DNA-binding NarL/FixJ family response regulator